MGGGFVGAYAAGFLPFDYHTAALDNVIDEEVPGVDGQRLALVSMNYLCGATAHDVNIMYASDKAAACAAGASRNSALSVAVSGQKDIICTVTPESPAGDAIANLDVVAYQLTDGTWEFNTAASLSSDTITLTNDIVGVDASAGATAVAAGGKVMVIGIIADGSLFKIHLVATATYDENNTILAWHPYIGEPFYVSNPNATAASFQNSLIFAYIANK